MFYLGKLPEAAVKKSTIFFYGSSEDGNKAKELVLAERKEHNNAYSRDASTFDGEKEKEITDVVIMPSVRPHHRAQVLAAYGDIVRDQAEAVAEEFREGDEGKSQKQQEDNGKKAVHRGGGKWYVMRDEEKISGPHTREEAEELAKQ